MIVMTRETEPEREPPRIDEIPRTKQIASEDKLTSCKCKSTGKNLVVCIDDISNQFSEKVPFSRRYSHSILLRHDILFENTNVVKLYRHLAKDEQQPMFYNSRVGTYARSSWRSFNYWKKILDNKTDLVIAW